MNLIIIMKFIIMKIKKNIKIKTMKQEIMKKKKKNKNFFQKI